MLAEESLKEFNLRKYLQIAFYETNLLIQDFRRNSKDENEFLMVFKIIHADWLKILSLAIPHLCEELWELAGNESYLSQVIWKGFQEKFINEDFESEFQYILNVIEDITNIKRVIKSEGIDKVYLYTAPLWKYKIDNIIISHEGNLKAAMNDIKSNSDLISNREAVNYAKKRNKERIWEFNRYDIDEERVLAEFEDVINNKSKSEIILNSDRDPKQKSKNALPNKPAIYIESK